MVFELAHFHLSSLMKGMNDSTVLEPAKTWVRMRPC